MNTHKITAQMRSAQNKKGFTLTEIAIVLGIIGLILGAIWVAAASVYANQKLAKANTEIMDIVQGTRTLYATSAVTGDAIGTSETTPLINAGVFPADITANAGTATASAVTAWGGTTTTNVYSQTAAVAGDSILVELGGIPSTACINLLTGLTGNGRDSGLWYAGASAATQKSATLAASTFPITAATASTACLTATVVDFMFKLKG